MLDTGGGLSCSLGNTQLVPLVLGGRDGLLGPHVHILGRHLSGSLLDLRESLSLLLGGIHGFLSPHVDVLGGDLSGSLLDLRESLSLLLGGIHSLLDGDRVGGGGGTVNGGMGEAVDLAINTLEVLEVEGDVANSAFEAPLVESLVYGRELLQRVDGLVADGTLGVGHSEFESKNFDFGRKEGHSPRITVDSGAERYGSKKRWPYGLFRQKFFFFFWAPNWTRTPKLGSFCRCSTSSK